MSRRSRVRWRRRLRAKRREARREQSHRRIVTLAKRLVQDGIYLDDERQKNGCACVECEPQMHAKEIRFHLQCSQSNDRLDKRVRIIGTGQRFYAMCAGAPDWIAEQWSRLWWQSERVYPWKGLEEVTNFTYDGMFSRDIQ